MNVKFFLVISFLFFSKASEKESIFWGKNGHRATGEIAEKYLNKRTKKRINKILNGQSLAFVSTYADEIKSDFIFFIFYLTTKKKIEFLRPNHQSTQFVILYKLALQE